MNKKQALNEEFLHMQKLAGIITEGEYKQKLNEAVFSSNDVTAILKAAETAVEAGKEVTVDGIKIGKVVVKDGAFIPVDGSEPYPKIEDYYDNMSVIVIDGIPAVFSSINAILKAAETAVKAGKEVTVDGIKIGKVVPAAGAFIPADGSKPYPRIRDYYNNMSAIVINGVPAVLKPMKSMEPSKPQSDTRTPEEKAKAQAAFDDRYGQGGGYDTPFGRYTGD